MNVPALFVPISFYDFLVLGMLDIRVVAVEH